MFDSPAIKYFLEDWNMDVDVVLLADTVCQTTPVVVLRRIDGNAVQCLFLELSNVGQAVVDKVHVGLTISAEQIHKMV